MNKHFTKVITILLVLMIVVTLPACQKQSTSSAQGTNKPVDSNQDSKQDESPEGVVKRYFKLLKENVAESDKLLEEQNSNQGMSAEDEEMAKLLTSKITAEVGGSTINGDQATVDAKITALDMSTVMTDAMAAAMSAAFSGQEVSEEFMTDYIKEQLGKTDAVKKTTDTKISLVKKDGKWLIKEDEAFADAVTGGFLTAIKNLMTSVGE